MPIIFPCIARARSWRGQALICTARFWPIGQAKAAFHLKPVVDRLAEHLKRLSKLFMEFEGTVAPDGAA